MPFRIIREDITRISADAIVNTANPEPVIGSGTDNAVYMAAGAEALLADRIKIGPIPPGEVAATGAHALHARYILHTVGPDWRREEPDRAAVLLASCYRKSLLLAQQLGCESIAFPLISAGNYGYPREQALQIALDTIRSFLQDADMDVTLAVYDRSTYALSTALTDHVDAYIDERYIEAKTGALQNVAHFRRRETASYSNYPGFLYHSVSGAPFRPEMEEDLSEMEEGLPEMDTDLAEMDEGVPMDSAPAPAPEHMARPSAARPAHRPSAARPAHRPSAAGPAAGSAAGPSAAPSFFRGRKLKDLLNRKQETFQQQLLRLIDEKGYTDVEVYKRANLDRKLFSKIRSNPEYKPQKRTAEALAMALRLNMDETTDFLRLAGLALSPANLTDVIIGYCIENRIYDLFDVNALLFEYDQPLLG